MKIVLSLWTILHTSPESIFNVGRLLVLHLISFSVELLSISSVFRSCITLLETIVLLHILLEIWMFSNMIRNIGRHLSSVVFGGLVELIHVYFLSISVVLVIKLSPIFFELSLLILRNLFKRRLRGGQSLFCNILKSLCVVRWLFIHSIGISVIISFKLRIPWRNISRIKWISCSFSSWRFPERSNLRSLNIINSASGTELLSLMRFSEGSFAFGALLSPQNILSF